MNKAINGALSFNESNDVNGITFKNWFAKDASGEDNHLVEVITDKDGREIKADKISHNNNEQSGYIKASNIASEKTWLISLVLPMILTRLFLQFQGSIQVMND